MPKGVYKRSEAEKERLTKQITEGRLKNLDWRKKALITRRKHFEEGKIIPYWKGKKNPALTKRNLENNPMKNPKIVKKMDYQKIGKKISKALKGHIVTEETRKKLTKKEKHKCPICEKEFWVQPYRFKKSKKVYCSRKCADKGKRKIVIKKCKECGKKFTTISSKNYQFCSYKCSAKNRERKGRSKEHKEKCLKALEKGRKNIIYCKKCGRAKSKNKEHICLTKKEMQKIAERNFNEKTRKKGIETRRKLNKEGKLKGVGFQKGHSVPKEWIEKAGKTRAKGIKEGRIVPYWKGKKRSEKEREKMSNSHIGLIKGKNHYNWSGGITPFIKARWSSTKYQKWRKAVFKKDDYTCQDCGKRCKKGLGKTIILNAHHIKSIYKYPELIFKVSNGKTLCLNCHLKYHKKHGFK